MKRKLKQLIPLVILAVTPKLVSAADLFLPDSPLTIGGGNTSLVQFVVERDNSLFFEAYPNYIDIDGDGVIDNTYRPNTINYAGYFDSNLCYDHIGGVFRAVSRTDDKVCTGYWSGDFLNYATMTRMDLLRKALYGGKRQAHPGSPNGYVLRRAFVPIIMHTWGVEYTSVEVNGYDLSQYAPVPMPSSTERVLFATNNSDMSRDNRGEVPYLLTKTVDSSERIWDWVDAENAQGDPTGATRYAVDVAVCLPDNAATDTMEDFCALYPNDSYKPVGLLHEFGESNEMYFSLITGSYENNLQGGVLRKKMESFADNEIDPDTGEFLDHQGIVQTLDRIRIPHNWQEPGGPRQIMQADCGWLSTPEFSNGQCKMYGNPVAEMMYEGMRYLAGKMNPTPDFDTNGGMDASVGLESTPWDDPYDAAQPYGECASAYQVVVSQTNTDYDGDQLPGSDFSSFNGSTLDSLHVGDIADFITTHEPDVLGPKFIGESGSENDRVPSVKDITSFRNIRGLAPDATHRQGSYYAQSVAYYGNQNDLHSTAIGDQTVKNITLELSAGLPAIDMEINGNLISFAPFARSVKNYAGSENIPNNEIMDFNVYESTTEKKRFRVSYSDTRQGSDLDMDASAVYTLTSTGGQLVVNVESDYAESREIQHMGYSISGTTADGIYLVVRDSDTRVYTNTHGDVDNKYDVPPGEELGGNWNDGEALPLSSTRTFTPDPSSSGISATLKSPLWYAAKWGGFEDANNDGIPQTLEWDSNLDGIPDNYFSVRNPTKLSDSLRTVLGGITAKTSGAAASVAASAGSLKLSDKIYLAKFTSEPTWHGDLVSRTVDENGKVMPGEDWSAKEALQDKLARGEERTILSYNPGFPRRGGVPFRWPTSFFGTNTLSIAQSKELHVDPVTSNPDDGKGVDRLNYIRGEEVENFRPRTYALGDIVNSSPVLVSSPASQYPRSWGNRAPEDRKPYADFVQEHKNRKRVVYAGANDGMLHAFDAGDFVDGKYTDGDGDELFAYIPSMLIKNLPELTSPNYGHKNYVNATPNVSDVFINREWRTVLIGGLGQGGRGLYALDITEPEKITEDTARDHVMWELSDKDNRDIGYTYNTPLIARTANNRWSAIVANGYNSSERNENNPWGGDGEASILIIDIENGRVVRKLTVADSDCAGDESRPNSMSQLTAIDLNGDHTVDRVYAGDLNGCVYSFDISSNYNLAIATGEVKHRAVDQNGNPSPITSRIAVGSHPTGEGVMLYFGTGKFLEPSDQNPKTSMQRIYGLWDRGPDTDTEVRTEIAGGNLLEQVITNQELLGFDSDNDGANDSEVEVRETSQEEIDWGIHEGWYMDLGYEGYTNGEQVIASPLLREGRIIFVTHIAEGGQCSPESKGWLMALDARSGAMSDDSLFDLNGDGKLNDRRVSGIADVFNPYATPTVISGEKMDYLVSQTGDGTDATSMGLSTSVLDGRLTWREIQP